MPILEPMGTRSNYDDNIFYIQAWLKTLRMTWKLELDSDLFLHRVMDNILFTHELLSKLHHRLMSNAQYIHRMEHMRLLLLAKKDFLTFLEDLQKAEGTFARQLASCSDQLEQCHVVHSADCAQIESAFESRPSNENDETDIISLDEYRLLFKDTMD